MRSPILILWFCVFLHHTLGANILIVFPHVYYNHFRATSTLVRELSLRGHNVTFVSPYPGEVDEPNITEISIESIIEPIKEATNDFFENENYWNCYFSKLQYARKIGYQYSKRILENGNFRKLITSNSTFDLVLVEDVAADGLAVLSYIFKCPLAMLLSEPLSVFYDNYVGDTILWKQHNDLRTAHYWVFKELYREWIILPSQNKLVHEIAPDAPDLRQILYQTSLVLSPSFSALGNLVPKYQNVKQIGGFHLELTRELPFKILALLGDSLNGVIAISNDLPNSVQKKLETIPGTVLFSLNLFRFMEQPNVKAKLFIGSGDVYDTAFGIYNQLPILSLSRNRWDQEFLIDSLTEKIMAVQMPIQDVGSPEFNRVVRFLTNDTRYQDNLRLGSEIIRYNAGSSMNEAISWIEYVIRFNGASHLRPDNLEWSIQNHLITIIIVLTILDIALFLLFYWIIKHFPRLPGCCTGKGLFKREEPLTIKYQKL